MSAPRMSDIDMLLNDAHKRWGDTEEFTACNAPAEKSKKTPRVDVLVRTSSPSEAAAQLRDRFRLSELERKVSDLIVTVSELKIATARPSRAAERYADPALADILAVTHELFPGKVGVELTCDPAEPEVDIVVFNVDGRGEFDALFDKEIEWGHRVAVLEPRHSGQLRLNVVPIK